MKEFRIGSIEKVRAFNSLSHPYPEGGGGGGAKGVKVRFPYTPIVI